MSARRFSLVGLVLSCVLCGGLALMCTSAQALLTHDYLRQESLSEYVPFNPVGRSAVDESTNPSDWAQGDTYEILGETGDETIGLFRPTGSGKREQIVELFGGLYKPPGEYHLGEVRVTMTSVAVDKANGALIAPNSIETHPLIGTEKTTLEEKFSIFEPSLPGMYAPVDNLTARRGMGYALEPGRYAVDQGTGEIYVVEEKEQHYEGEPAIDEFSSSGTYLGTLTGAGSASGHFGNGISVSVDPTTNDLYVDDQSDSVVDIYGPDVTVPDVTTGVPSHLKGTSTVLTGTVDPDAAGPGTCQFVWGPTKEFGHVAQCSESVAEGDNPASVYSANLEGLEPGREYCYRLQATNANGTDFGEESQDRCFTAPGLEDVEASALAITSESATLAATLEPDYAPATYYFQYGTTSDYGTDVPVAPGASVGATEGDVDASQHVQGLEAGTIYHYRVVEVREPEQGAFETLYGPDQTFTTESTRSELGLLDGREWELVTPPDKQGALFYPDKASGLANQASVDGDAIVDLASRPTESEPQGYVNEVSVLSTRGPDGWSSQVIASPHDVAAGPNVTGGGGEYRIFSEDLSLGALQPYGATPTPLSPEATESTPYLRTDFLNGDVSDHCSESCFEPLVTRGNTLEHAVFGVNPDGESCTAVSTASNPSALCGPHFLDATPNLSHIVFNSPVQLTPTAPHGPVGYENGGLYEWSDGQLQYIGVLPEGEIGEDSRIRLAGVSSDELEGSSGDGGFLSAKHAISENGARVILTAPKSSANAGVRLYLRDVVKGETILLSQEGVFLTASTDDSRIFFLEGGSISLDNGGQLNECKIVEVAGKLHCELAHIAPRVTEVLGASEDGSYLYFTTGKRSGDGVSSVSNVYVDHDGVTSQVSAGVEELDRAQVSPDGKWLAFLSDSDLTGYDTEDAVTGKPDMEVYLYDADTSRLVCASCDPTGSRPVGIRVGESQGELDGQLVNADDGYVGQGIAAELPDPEQSESNEFQLNLYQPRYVFDDGRLFFDSDDALVPQDVNGTWDVYEYEPVGVPAGADACATSSVAYSERSDGCVGLVSSGASAEESAFLDASGTGGDAFFLTSAKLVPADYDDAYDVYDAHECTASAPCFSATAGSSPPCSTGDSCKPAPTPQPSIFGVAPSETFSGVGNVSPTVSTVVVSGKSVSKTRQLERALRMCRRDRGRKRRVVCERDAHRRYGAVASRTASSKRKAR
jgi:hypothetical protein